MGFPILLRWHLYIESAPPPLASLDWAKTTARRDENLKFLDLMRLMLEVWRYSIFLCFDRFVTVMHGGIISRCPLPWRHNGHDSVSYHQPHHCLLNRLCGCRSKETSKLRVTGLCAGNSPGTGEFPAQMASNAENVSIWWRHHALIITTLRPE